MLKLFDTVTLKNDDPETGVKAGTERTIVDVLGNGKAFTVEFFDEDGNTIEASLYTEYTPARLQKVETALTLHSRFNLCKTHSMAFRAQDSIKYKNAKSYIEDWTCAF